MAQRPVEAATSFKSKFGKVGVMRYFSNDYAFPVLQLVLFGTFLFALYRDIGGMMPSGISATISRGKESMDAIEKATGLAIAALVTIINKSVFDGSADWKAYSAVFNIGDIVTIIYICYFSSWGRNKIVGIYNSSRTEKR